jgi:hypothetical protein
VAAEIAQGGSDKQKSEIGGLLGRAMKQRFVQAVNQGKDGAEELRASIAQYASLYPLDPAWHGTNVVALKARAERVGIAVDGDSAKVWAKRLLSELDEKGRASWSPWDYASAGEAYLALDQQEKVADAFGHYWTKEDADAFALAGTERQLREIWQVDVNSKDPFLVSLLATLTARRLAKSGGEVRYKVEDIVKVAQHLETARAEAMFGAQAALPIERMLGLLAKARSVCRVVDPLNPTKGGTGFLLKGSDLSAGLDGRCFVLTNHHVLHGTEANEERLATPAYKGSVDVERADAHFHYWNGKDETRKLKLKEVVRYSYREDADFALATLEDDVSPDHALKLSALLKPLGSRNWTNGQQRGKIFVIGHPQGGVLSFSVSDNDVVDHELDDQPLVPPHSRRIHYRAPTEPGSSGSPVLLSETLDVVGLHRTGGAKPLRPDWPKSKPDELYQANEAVAIRSIRDFLA